MEMDNMDLGGANVEEMFEIPSIVDSISQTEIENFQPYYKRFYEDKYSTKFSTETRNLDTLIKVHTNKVCVVYLSEKHSIFEKKQRIKNFNFQVTNKVDRLQNMTSGKGKRGAQHLAPNSILCFIETEDGELYPIHAGINGKLLEINDQVLDNHNLLLDNPVNGFLAIILPDLKLFEDDMNLLINKDTYFSDT